MTEKFDPKSQEENPESLSKKERFESLCKVFDEAEAVFASEGREELKTYLTRIYDDLIALNKRDTEDWMNVFVWNPDGDLTEQEFNTLNLRRKKLSTGVGMRNSGEIRHDLNEI
ncbi:MAG: hypothetical protein Q7S11_00455 [bacterium]|nr:hypothetical protein [bacterium]